MEVEGREKLGEVTALLLDNFEELGPTDLPESSPLVNLKVEEVITVVELSAKYADGDEWCRVMIKSSTESPVYKRGLISSAAAMLDAVDDDD